MAEYLVTGGTSFIASHVVKALLDFGYFEKLADRDIYGTRNLMNSCEKSRNTVKRIVLTSSSTSVRYSYDATKASPLKGSHWSDLEYFRSFSIWYGYAKTLVEKEAWLIAAEKNLNLVVVIPSFCIGPILSPKPTSSPSIFLSIIKGVHGEYPNFRGGFVHIDDVAAAQILAMKEPKASGRIICSSSVAHWCGSEEGRDMPHSLDTRKIHELGFRSFKSLPEMFDDCIKCFKDKGLL
uniref:NAD-dependent epimerase/dehydratase domain-containing protein n=1 Tax=Brassica campestris TaxID=3711 RepID=M4E7J2_BRACM